MTTCTCGTCSHCKRSAGQKRRFARERDEGRPPSDARRHYVRSGVGAYVEPKEKPLDALEAFFARRRALWPTWEGIQPVVEEGVA